MKTNEVFNETIANISLSNPFEIFFTVMGAPFMIIPHHLSKLAPDLSSPVRYPVVGYNSELKEHIDPLSRTGRYFGGLIRDVKTLRKRYLS